MKAPYYSDVTNAQRKLKQLPAALQAQPEFGELATILKDFGDKKINRKPDDEQKANFTAIALRLMVVADASMTIGIDLRQNAVQDLFQMIKDINGTEKNKEPKFKKDVKAKLKALDVEKTQDVAVLDKAADLIGEANPTKAGKDFHQFAVQKQLENERAAAATTGAVLVATSTGAAPVTAGSSVTGYQIIDYLDNPKTNTSLFVRKIAGDNPEAVLNNLIMHVNAVGKPEVAAKLNAVRAQVAVIKEIGTANILKAIKEQYTQAKGISSARGAAADLLGLDDVPGSGGNRKRKGGASAVLDDDLDPEDDRDGTLRKRTKKSGGNDVEFEALSRRYDDLARRYDDLNRQGRKGEKGDTGMSGGTTTVIHENDGASGKTVVVRDGAPGPQGPAGRDAPPPSGGYYPQQPMPGGVYAPPQPPKFAQAADTPLSACDSFKKVLYGALITAFLCLCGPLGVFLACFTAMFTVINAFNMTDEKRSMDIEKNNDLRRQGFEILGPGQQVMQYQYVQPSYPVPPQPMVPQMNPPLARQGMDASVSAQSGSVDRSSLDTPEARVAFAKQMRGVSMLPPDSGTLAASIPSASSSTGSSTVSSSSGVAVDSNAPPPPPPPGAATMRKGSAAGVTDVPATALTAAAGIGAGLQGMAKSTVPAMSPHSHKPVRVAKSADGTPLTLEQQLAKRRERSELISK